MFFFFRIQSKCIVITHAKGELNSVTLLMNVGVASDETEATGQLAVDISELLFSCRSTSEGRKRETETSNVKGKRKLA